MSRSKKYLGGALAGLLALFAAAVVATPAFAASPGNTTQSVGGYTFTSEEPIIVAGPNENGRNADIVYTGSNQTSADTVTVQGAKNLNCNTVSTNVVPLTLSGRFSGSLTFTNVSLQAASAAGDQTGKYLIDAQGGTLAMNRGSIAGIVSSDDNSGSALQVGENANVTLTGVGVTGGKGASNKNGGNAISVAGGTLVVTSGSIAGGDGNTEGVGGVGISQNDGNVTLGGVSVNGGTAASAGGKAGANAVEVTGGTLVIEGGSTLTGSAGVGGSASAGGSAIYSNSTNTPVAIEVGSCTLTAGQATLTNGNVPAVILGGSTESSLTFTGNASLTSNSNSVQL